MSLDKQITILDTATQLLIAEGYTKDYYEVDTTTAEKWTDSFTPGEDTTVCGKARCAIGGIDAAANTANNFKITAFSDEGHEGRLAGSGWDGTEYDDDLVAVYKALNTAAEKHTRRRSEDIPEYGYGAAESYAEHKNTTRDDVIKLYELAKQYL